MKRLQGKKVLVTRARSQSSVLVKAIEALGGEAIEFPVIKIQTPTDEHKRSLLAQTMRSLAQYDRIIFTSVNGVEVFFQQLAHLNIDPQSFDHAVIETVGPKTAKALTDRGVVVEPLPLVYQAEGLLDMLLPKLKGHERILIFRSELARDVIPNELTKLGHDVEAIDAYETVISDDGAEEIIGLLQREEIDVVTFTSSSTVHNLISILKQRQYDDVQLLKPIDIACIGPITAQTVEDYGLTVTFLAKEATIESLVNELS